MSQSVHIPHRNRTNDGKTKHSTAPRTADDHVDRVEGERVEGWLRDSAIAGFIATFAFSVAVSLAYAFASAVGDEKGGTVQNWFYNLVHNPLVKSTEDRITLALTLNIAAGMAFALIYGRFAEPHLPGKGWVRGALFSLVPFVLSITVFFPLMDVGIFGSRLDAGPLPILGNLAAHLVYGAVLGWIYSIALESAIDDTPLDRAANEGAERGAARGVPYGAVLGGIIALIVSPTLTDLTSVFPIVVIGALVGGAIGLLVGSLIGMGELVEANRWEDEDDPSAQTERA